MTTSINHFKNYFSNRHDTWVSLFLILSTLSVYWRVCNYDFVNFDDFYIYNNSYVQSGLTLKGTIWAFTTNLGSYWHPLAWLSHMLDSQIYGTNPGWHHLTSLLIHIANALLLFYVFKKMTGLLWQSACIAALFALHPLHVESVAWISERKDVLCTFFWLLTMWGYIRYIRQPGIAKYSLVLLFFILGLMSKPMVVTLPCVLLLLDFYPLCRYRKSSDSSGLNQWSLVSRLILEKVPFFILVIISSVVTFYDQKDVGALVSLDAIPFHARLSNALVAYAYYIIKMIYPSNLALLYPHPGVLPWWQITGAFLLLVFISVWAIRVIKRSPYFIVGWLWYLGTLVPVIGLVQVGSQSMADRYTYIPLIGIFVIFSWGSAEFVKRWRHGKTVLIAITTAILFAIMVSTYIQVGYWKNSIVLFENTLAVTTNNSVPHNNLGLALYNKGRIDEAIGHYAEAIRIRPGYNKAHYNMGNAQYRKGRINEAIKHYMAALRDNSDFVEAHNNLGLALKRTGRISDAIKHYKEALRINPDFDKAHQNLGNVLRNQGRMDEAIKHYEETLRINPNSKNGYINLAVALYKKNDFDAAIDNFRKALQIDPDCIQSKTNINKILMLQKQRQMDR